MMRSKSVVRRNVALPFTSSALPFTPCVGLRGKWTRITPGHTSRCLIVLVRLFLHVIGMAAPPPPPPAAPSSEAHLFVFTAAKVCPSLVTPCPPPNAESRHPSHLARQPQTHTHTHSLALSHTLNARYLPVLSTASPSAQRPRVRLALCGMVAACAWLCVSCRLHALL